MTAPSSGAIVTSTITLSATANDNVGVSGVQFLLDGVNVGSEDTVSPYSVSWNTATSSDGSHIISALARDAAGNTGTSSVTVTVNNTGAATPGDLNGDKVVNILDLNLVIIDFGKTSGFNPAVDTAAPFGTIDLFDVMVIVINWGRNY